MLRKPARLDFKLRKTNKIIPKTNNDIIPNILCFRTANKNFLWNSAVIFTYFLFHLLLTTIATTIYCHLRIVGDWRKCSYFLKPCINYVFQVSLSSISKKEKEEWDSYKRLCHI